jgi:hypothetical protein
MAPMGIQGHGGNFFLKLEAENHVSDSLSKLPWPIAQKKSCSWQLMLTKDDLNQTILLIIVQSNNTAAAREEGVSV